MPDPLYPNITSMFERPSLGRYMLFLREMGRLTPVVQEACEKAERLRSEHKTIIYLAGALTGVPEAMKQRYVQLYELVGSYDGMYAYAPHMHGTDPVKHPDVTFDEVRDIDCLFSMIVADYHINFWDPMAHGNAIEEAWGEMVAVPSVYLMAKDVRLSRLPKGMWNIGERIEYADFDTDAVPRVREWLEHVQAAKV